MKTRLCTLALCLAGSFNLGLFQASAEFEVSAGINIQSPADFYQPLAARGAWIQVGTFGRCWHPAVTAEWKPYCNGSWEWTDCGWYWVSDEPWAWACYHYGTWAFDPSYGWVWIPGVEWAPAWVNWRTGGDYIGWAPCGPSGITIDASYYVFVQSQHFNDHIRPDNVVANNASILSRTSEIRNIGREQRQIGGRSQTVVVNHGPDLAMVEKTTGHKFTTVSVEKADQSTSRSIPEQMRRQTVKPDEQRTPAPDFGEPQRPVQELPKQRPIEELPKTSPDRNQELPHNFQPRQELPSDRNLPPERTVPPTSPERAVPQAPLHRMVPPVNSEPPEGKGVQSSKGIIPSTQVPPHQPVPVVPPGNGAPVEKGKDNDHNDHN
jgi:hypothetical protein